MSADTSSVAAVEPARMVVDESGAQAVIAAAAARLPAHAHRTFRAVLDALARPGTVVRLPETEVPPVLLPLLALADLGTGICVLDADPRWPEAARIATDAPAVGAEKAKFVAALRNITGHELRGMCRGSAPRPEAGALVTLGVPALAGGTRTWRLIGPGVDGSETIAPQGLPADFVAARAETVADYPAGVDVLLVDGDGWALGLPRTAVIEER